MERSVEQGGPVQAAGKDFVVSFTVEQPPEVVYAAINNVRGWWHETIDGRTDQLGAEWVFHNEPIHIAKFRITEMVPSRRVKWLRQDPELARSFMKRCDLGLPAKARIQGYWHEQCS